MVYWRTGGRSVYLISLGVSIFGRPRASMAAIFRQSAGYVLVNENSSNCTSRLVQHSLGALHFYSREAVSWAELYCGDVGCSILSSDALRRFTFVHTAKLKTSNFLNIFFLSLTAFVRVTSFLILSLAKVLRSIAWLDFDHTWPTSLNKLIFTLSSLIWVSLRSKEIICSVKVPNKRHLRSEC